MSYAVRGRVNFSQGQRVRGMGVEQYFKREAIVCCKFFFYQHTVYPKAEHKNSWCEACLGWKGDLCPTEIHRCCVHVR